MARRGKFGKLTVVSSSITSSIISIAREMQQQEYQNMLDAWKNGGTVDGKPVTDEMFLAYVKGRLDGLSTSDPMYDSWKLQYDQTDYGIQESKQYTLYKQGRISDNQMAQFYLNWAKKVPSNSEFYRTLQKDAAQFTQAAAARGRAGAAKAKSDAYNAYAQEIGNKYIAVGDLLTQTMTTIAKNNNLIGADQDLSDFMLAGQNDPGRMETLLGQINAAMKADPKTYAAFVNQIKSYDPSWDGNLTSAYFASALKSSVQGHGLLAARATKDGYTSVAKAQNKAAGAATTLGSQVRSWPVAASYQQARDQFDRVYNDPTATQLDKSQAAADFAQKIDTLAATPGLDTAMSNRLKNDALAYRGDPRAANQPSYYENYLGSQHLTVGETSTSTGEASGENVRFQQEFQRASYMQAQMAANPLGFVYASSVIGPDGVPTYDPSGKGEVAIVPKSSVDLAGNTFVVPVPTVGGDAIMQAIPVHDVIMEDPTGNNSKGTQVGVYMQYSVGGQKVTLYGVTQADGTKTWTPVSPFSDTTMETVKPDGTLSLSVPNVADPNAELAGLDAQYPGLGLKGIFSKDVKPAAGEHWTYVTQAKPAKGTPGQESVVTITWTGRGFTTSTRDTSFDAAGSIAGTQTSPTVPVTPPQTVDAAWDKARLAHGLDPRIDFTTPAMAALVASKVSGDSVVNAWNDPLFQQKLYEEENRAANGDPNKLAAIAAADQALAHNMADIGPDVAYHADREYANGRGDLLVQSLGMKQTGQPAVPAVRTGTAIIVPSAPVPSFGTEYQPGKAQDDLLYMAGSLAASSANRGRGGALPYQNAPTTPVPSPTITPKPTPTPTPAPTTTPKPTPTPTPAPIPTTPNVNAQTGFVMPTYNPASLPMPMTRGK
jgi:hypothetical protein